MNNQKISFPQYIDNPNQVGPFEADDFIPVFLFVEIGVFIKMKLGGSALSFLACFTLGILSMIIFIRFKRNHLRGLLQYIIYSLGILPLNKVFKNGLQRRVEH